MVPIDFVLFFLSEEKARKRGENPGFFLFSFVYVLLEVSGMEATEI